MNKLNEQYFKTRRNHERNYKNRKRLTWKKRILNIILTLILIFFTRKIHNFLYTKYEENKKKDILRQQMLKEKEKVKDSLQLKDYKK